MPPVQSVGVVVIEDVTPQVDCGRCAAKRVVGDTVEATARLFKDGHDALAAAVLYRAASDAAFLAAPMACAGGDRWVGRFQVDSNEAYEFTVEAWVDRYGTFCRDLRARIDALQDVTLEVREGADLVREAVCHAAGPDAALLARALAHLAHAGDPYVQAEILRAPGLADTVARALPRVGVTRYAPALPLWVDRPRARFASWYEFFPRSEGARAGHGGTLADAARRLPAIAQMGFDVVYLPPIHPIGRTGRKGANNTLAAGPHDPGSPWAVGSAAGGHTAVEPALGTLEDFDKFLARARDLGLEVALDLAFQCSPDHPWVREHPAWFFRRPDGSVRHAENPPKKYQDVYPLSFWGEHRAELWQALLDVVRFWLARGVRTFRVDNPHTKPVAFWQWLIAEVHATDPDAVFLAEAFTAAPMMRALARAGFAQGYTYFIWKTAKPELTDYLTELTRGEMREYFRGHLWPNTPDVLHAYLQRARRPAFKARAVLAATLSSLWGIYSGYELMENLPLREGGEDYLDAEKYEHRPRDYAQPESLVGYITRLNAARRAHRALQLYDNLRFVHADDPHILAYVKATPDRSDVVVVAVNLDPTATHASDLWIDPAELGVGPDEDYAVRDALTDEVYAWRGGHTWVRLDPYVQPAHVLALERRGAARTA